MQPHQSLDYIGTPRSYHPGQTEDLTPFQSKTDIPDFSLTTEILHLQQGLISGISQIGVYII